MEEEEDERADDEEEEKEVEENVSSESEVELGLEDLQVTVQALQFKRSVPAMTSNLSLSEVHTWAHNSDHS